MRQELITPSLLKRIGSRSNLGPLLLVGGMFCLFRVTLGPPGVRVLELALPFILLLAHLAFSPLPWQWTGDDAAMAGLGRGFIQALLFNLAWVLLLMAILHLAGPDRPPGLGPPPPGPAGFPGGPRPPHGWPPSMGLALVNVAFAIVFGWVFAEKEATESRERGMAGLLRQSRARALQNQLEPHVLYNALNGLSELVHDDPPAAEEMIARLADLYRMLTRHGEAEFVPLATERRLVELYLHMERMRLGDRLRIRWDWPGWADAVLLPPLFLQPLVENAVKHGISPCADGGELRLSCARDGEAVVLSVANTGRPLAPGAREGIGLGHLRARLELWMEAAAAFTLVQDHPWTVATVRWTARKP
jgi:hypothetical protein